MKQRGQLRSQIPTIVFSITASYFALGFFQNFYSSLLSFSLLAVSLNMAFRLVFDVIFEHTASKLQEGLKEKILPLAVLALGFLWAVFTFRLLAQYPTLFSFDLFLPDPLFIPLFIGLTLLAQVPAAFLLKKLDSTDWRTWPFIIWIKRNLPGLPPASAIFISSYALATALVESEPGFADNYFDTDSPFWLNFLTAEPDQMMTMRAVHPLALLILRPPAWLFSLLLNGDRFHAAILLNSLFGGVCVLLAWSFFKQRTGNTAYAMLMASLLGFSTSHLLLNVFLESYIFSAAVLITFFVLLQSRKTTSRLIPLGLVTFGITITNFVQTCIAHLLVRRNIRDFFIYVIIVLALAVPLAFLQHTLYPSSKPFYIPSNLTGEGAYRHDLLELPSSVVLSRANVIFRNMALFSVVAPRPLILLEEIGCSFPCFNTIHFFRGSYQYASYIGFGSWLVRIWFLGLVAAAALFAWRLIRAPREVSLQAALALNLLFNFVLHMNYGDDPLLYSPDWTYALVFFLGISFEKLSNKKWFQIVLLVFLAALMFNNLEFFRKVLDAVMPFVN
jgi:hypothetical protein